MENNGNVFNDSFQSNRESVKLHTAHLPVDELDVSINDEEISPDPVEDESDHL